MIPTNKALQTGQADDSAKPATNKKVTNNNDHFLATLDPSFIHRVLLSDPSDFSSLSTSKNGNASSRYTPSFEEFNHSLRTDNRGEIGDLDPSMIMKKAVRDHLLQHLLNRQSQNRKTSTLIPMCDLLLEAHQSIRSLIPNRRDLHSILDDAAVEKVQSKEELLPFVAKAATALSQLESESRVVTTRALIVDHLQQQYASQWNDEKDALEFFLHAILYLLFKTELCQADKDEYYMVHVWAPRIYQEGHTFVRSRYQEQFGAFSDSNSSPATRRWIRSLASCKAPRSPANPQAHDGEQIRNFKPAIDENNRLSNLKESPEERMHLIRSSWVDDIVFRGAVPSDEQNFQLPEIFLEDRDTLQSLREVSRLAVAGSALVLHACTTAKITRRELLGKNEKKIEKQKQVLVNAMRNRSLPQEMYENQVCNAVAELLREWNPTLFDNDSNYGDAMKSLRNRTVSVLRGEDPVLQLLNNRVRLAIRDIVTRQMYQRKTVIAPLNMRSGIAGHSQTEDSQNSDSTLNDDTVEKLLCQRGLGVFASELALVAKQVGKIVDLAIGIYWDDLLNKLILDGCCLQE